MTPTQPRLPKPEPDKLPPYNLEAEMSVLGSMMISQEAAEYARENLQSVDFYDDRHRKLFRALSELAGEGIPGELVMVSQKLGEMGVALDAVDGRPYMSICMDQFNTAENIEHFVKVVADTAHRRRAIDAGYGIIFAAQTGEPFEDYLDALKESHTDVPGRPETIDGKALDSLVLDPPRWAVPEVLPQGLSLLAGKPKQGKSFLSINIALAIAYGGKVLDAEVELGEVLCLALEDSPRRLQDRCRSMLQGDSIPDTVHFAFEWARLNDGGAEHLDRWLTEHPDTRLVVVDTLAKVRERGRGNSQIYLDDYSAIGPLKELADKYHIALLAVHHLRKSESISDPLDEVSGSTGLTGSADTVLLLRGSRGRSDAELMIIGRDMEDTELALDFDSKSCTWSLLGPAEEYRQSELRTAILEVLRESDLPLGPRPVADLLGRNESTIGNTMRRMAVAGDIKQSGRGRFSVDTGKVW